MPAPSHGHPAHPAHPAPVHPTAADVAKQHATQAEAAAHPPTGTAAPPDPTAHPPPGTAAVPAAPAVPAVADATPAVATGTTVTTTPTHGAHPASPTQKAVAMLLKPRGNQILLADGAAAEIRQAGTTGIYATAFGPTAPPAEQVAGTLELAGAASLDAKQKHDAWVASRDRAAKLWDTALREQINPFKEHFDFAVAHTDGLAAHFHTTSVFLATPSQIGVRGAATRKAKAKARKAAGG